MLNKTLLKYLAEMLGTLIPKGQSLPLDLLVLAIRYLHQFGYLPSDPAKLRKLKPADMKPFVKKAQKLLGVDKVDGWVGHITLKAMETVPRCGCSDVQYQRSVLNRWSPEKAKEGLTYHVVNYIKDSQISKDDQEAILADSFSAWEKYGALRMIRTKSMKADILIDASASRREEFGTVGNVLAWAQLPWGSNHVKQLIMKFDLAERWIKDRGLQGILFDTVAKHEFGHLWGLDHTQIRGELMFPTYDVNVNDPQSRYDIPEFQRRYPGDPVTPLPPEGGEDAQSVIERLQVFDGSNRYKLVRV